MSGLCGHVGPAPDHWLPAMLGAIGHRGDTDSTVRSGPFAAGVRLVDSRPDSGAATTPAAGSRTWAVAGYTHSAKTTVDKLDAALMSGDWATVDGAFAAACWDTQSATLTLVRDPFGVAPLYYATVGESLVFSSELKQLLAIAELPAQVDASALHKYLTFSFVPGDATPIAGVQRLLPGQLLRWSGGAERCETWFSTRQVAHAEPTSQAEAAQSVWRLGMAATRRRWSPDLGPVGVYLSGGIDSAAVALWLKRLGAEVVCLSLDFGEAGREKAQAQAVADHLGAPLHWVPVTGEALHDALLPTVRALDLPFGDAVTVPQMLLGRAAKALGLRQVFNGEFGDQLLGGWTQKPMLAAAMYADADDEPEEQYLHAFHRFYGVEDQLYTNEFAAQIGGPGQRRALLRPYLGDPSIDDFLTRVRLADLRLKGSQNILPRAERITAALGLELRMPFADRALAEYCLRLPPDLKLHGANEKFALKVALQGKLPGELIWRRKAGMGAPVTDWLMGPLRDVVEDVLGEASVRRRGYFRPDYIGELRAGKDHPLETRRRRIGEKLWALLMLELWLRQFVDSRGQGAA